MFELACYSGVIKPDSLTESFRQRAALWRDIAGVSDAAVAEMIREEGVDILVDLSQHTAGNRLPLFARGPAFQCKVSFAGYPESAGVEAIGHRISDRYLESEIGSEIEDGRWKIGWKREPELRSPNPDLRPATQEQVFLIDSFWSLRSVRDGFADQ